MAGVCLSVLLVVTGLVAPVVGQTLMGDTGEVMVALMVMMAVTSTGSAEVIAVTSILVYDIYQVYLKVGESMAPHTTLCPKLTQSLFCYYCCWTHQIIVALDFSKAFDTVRHHTLFEKFANLAIPDNTYNWLVQFFQGHSHCTKFGNQTSALREITASIVQGSANGPASYVITSCDLTTTTAGNRVCKYADDT